MTAPIFSRHALLAKGAAAGLGLLAGGPLDATPPPSGSAACIAADPTGQ